MARTKTTGELMTRIRDLGEIRSSYVTNAMLVREIDQSRLELLDKLIDAGSSDYFESTNYTSIVSGTNTYALPSDHYQTLGMSIKLDNGDYAAMERYSYQDRHVYDSSYSSYIKPFREKYQYRIRGANTILTPTPDFSETNGLLHTYVAVPAALNTASTVETIDGFHGYEDYIVYDVLIKFVGGKEEGDDTTWKELLGKCNARIERMKNKRDRANADQVADVEWPRRGRFRGRWGVSV